jgi:SAM-dependent MidA family methyltransferase
LDGKLRRNSEENPNAKTTVSNPELIAIIRGEIEARGPISFARFMELALYHPEHGYYASGRARIGRRGDFFTNVSVGPLFGKLLAAQFAQVWQKLERPVVFKIVEQGADEALFAADVLRALRQSHRECFEVACYLIIEPFPILRERQQENLRDFAEKISWTESIKDLEPFVGIHFSNELFDSLPAHLLVSRGVAQGATVWNEKFVTNAGDRFAFTTRTDTSANLQVDHLGIFPTDFETELNLAAPELMSQIAAKLSRGVILVIDYGFSREEFYADYRNKGTLQVRAKHKKLLSPLEQIGLADISAHVEWTSLIEAAQSSGAIQLAFIDQHHFFTGIISEFFPDAAFNASEKRALQTLLHPEMLGQSFQVLALGKDFHEKLAGFRFARGPGRFA